VDLDPERQSNRDKEVGRGGLSPLAPTRLHPGAQDPTVVITAGQADRSSRRSSLSGLVGHVPGVGRHHRAPTGIVVEAEEIGVAPDEGYHVEVLGSHEASVERLVERARTQLRHRVGHLDLEDRPGWHPMMAGNEPPRRESSSRNAVS